MKKATRLTQVSQVVDLSPHLRRIILTGEALSDFSQEQIGAYVKVLLPSTNKTNLNFNKKEENVEIKRSYTIQNFNPDTKELSLDFVINCHDGPASNWAKAAKIGDKLKIAGPGPRKLTNLSASSYLFIGDLTSINAIVAYNKMIPTNAISYIFITVPTKQDIPKDNINMFAGSTSIHWIIDNGLDEYSNQLLEKLITLPKLPTDTQVFIGAEAHQVRITRNYLSDEHNLNNFAASAYWKKGVDADGRITS